MKTKGKKMNYYTPNKLSAKATIEMDKGGEVF